MCLDVLFAESQCTWKANLKISQYYLGNLEKCSFLTYIGPQKTLIVCTAFLPNLLVIFSPVSMEGFELYIYYFESIVMLFKLMRQMPPSILLRVEHIPVEGLELHSHLERFFFQSRGVSTLRLHT